MNVFVRRSSTLTGVLPYDVYLTSGQNDLLEQTQYSVHRKIHPEFHYIDAFETVHQELFKV